ncbi:MAG TPA: CARDB domain-containing protein, partial [Pirellulaceae bacterium]|nr:CARDB domain-containing protein [Pirellulaceae bacterium]
YTVHLGPQITDLDGNAMVVPFDATFRIDKSGPRIVASTPAVTVDTFLDSIQLTFDTPIDTATLTAGDVVLSSPQGVAIPVTVTRLGADSFRLSFTRQAAPGDYSLAVGPQVANLLGSLMDQDGDAQLGEAVDDVFRATITLRQPNLIVQSATAPSSVFDGQTLTVSWTGLNGGVASAPPSWFDRVVLSRDSYYGSFDDLVLGDATTSTTVASDGTYSRSVSATVPWDAQGLYTIFIKLDAGDALPESSETDNLLAIPVQILYARPPADLVIDALETPPQATTGQPAQVSWRVRNDGDAATSATRWTDRVWLSSDNVFGNDLELGTVVRTGAVASDGTYSVVSNFTIPPQLAAGAYWVFVQTDSANEVVEPTGETNNVRRSDASIDIGLGPTPDLVVTDVVGPATASGGATITVTWNDRNSGGATA